MDTKKRNIVPTDIIRSFTTGRNFPRNVEYVDHLYKRPFPQSNPVLNYSYALDKCSFQRVFPRNDTIGDFLCSMNC